MKLSDLVEGYELLCSTSQLDPLYSETGRTVLLHDDGPVRIYLVKEPDIWEDITLEIDIFMGVGRISDSIQSKSPQNRDDYASLSKAQLVECISYIEYLLRLEEAGFNLEIVLDGCIWTARYLVSMKPDSRLFEIIAPPIHQNPDGLDDFVKPKTSRGVD
ncbi:MAG: hypothetical protein ACFFCX_03845 [Candidatus Sifarchaeia archaeon]